jgi:hypothetical protein
MADPNVFETGTEGVTMPGVGIPTAAPSAAPQKPQVTPESIYEQQTKAATELGGLVKSKAETEAKAKELEQAQYRGIQQQYEPALKAVDQAQPEFKPSPQTQGELVSLFGMIGAIGAFAGSGGYTSALGAMNAMGGMLKGYNEGRKDLFEREKAIFEEKMKENKARYDRMSAAFERAIKMAPYNLAPAQTELQRKLIAEGANILAKQVEMEGINKAATTFSTLKTREEQIRALGEKMVTVIDPVTKSPIFVTQRQAQAAAEAGIPYGAPAKSGYQSVLLAGRADNVKDAVTQIAADLENLAGRKYENLVLGTFAGMAGESGTTLTSSLKNTFARNITPDEQRTLQQLITGIETNLSMALGGGYATSGAKFRIEQWKSQVPRSGDSGYVVANFLARVKQEMQNLAENFPSKPGVTTDQINKVQSDFKRIERAIPFNVNDVERALFAGEPPPATSGQSSSSGGLPGGWSVR